MIFKPGSWLADSTAASQSEAMLENSCHLTWILLSNLGPWIKLDKVYQHQISMTWKEWGVTSLGTVVQVQIQVGKICNTSDYILPYWLGL